MTVQDQPPFPLGHGSITATTKRGRNVQIRHIAPADADLLVDLFNHLSFETRRRRFFLSMADIPEEIVRREATRLSDIDPQGQVALIGTVEESDQERAIGVVRLVCTIDDPATAEIAVVVRDDYQGEGLGVMLIDLIIQVALGRGLKRLQGFSLAENEAVQKIARKSGLPMTIQTLRGETTITVLLNDSE